MGNGGLMVDEFEVHNLNVSRGVEIGARTGDGRQIQANPHEFKSRGFGEEEA